MSEIKHQLKEVRPSLYTVAPLTFCICWGYAAVNILIGLGMFFFYVATSPIAVAEILSYQQWGMVFFSMGVLNIIGLVTNNWNLTRNTQLLGLLVKAIWAIALIVRTIYSPETIVITTVWLFFAFVQAVTYIFFIPKQFLPGGNSDAAR